MSDYTGELSQTGAVIGTASVKVVAVLWRDAGTLASWSPGGGSYPSGAADPPTEVPDPLGQLDRNVLRQHLTGPGGCRQFRWEYANGQNLGTDLWFSWYMHLPSLAPVTDYWNVWQTKIKGPDFNAVKTIVNGTGTTQGGRQGFQLLNCFPSPGCDNANSSPTFYVSTGRNVKMEVHQRFATNTSGFIVAYMDDAQVAEIRDIVTQYPSSSPDARQVSWNNYAGANGIGDYALYHGKATISANRVTDMPVMP